LIQVKAAPRRAARLPTMGVLNCDDREFLGRFFDRLLGLHAYGVVTTESAMEYLARIVEEVDLQTPEAIVQMRTVLADAWRDDD
jgi:hypothetical protein